MRGRKPSLTIPAALRPIAPLSLVVFKSLPSPCFSLPGSGGENRAQILDVEMHSCPVNHKPLAPQVQLYSQEDTLRGRLKKRFLATWENKEGKLSFLSFRNFVSSTRDATRLDLVLRTHPKSDSLCLQRPYSPPPSTFLC